MRYLLNKEAEESNRRKKQFIKDLRRGDLRAARIDAWSGDRSVYAMVALTLENVLQRPGVPTNWLESKGYNDDDAAMQQWQQEIRHIQQGFAFMAHSEFDPPFEDVRKVLTEHYVDALIAMLPYL